MSTADPASLAAPDPAADAAIADALRHIATPGSFYTGAERIALARYARVCRGFNVDSSSSSDLSPVVADAVRRVAVDAKDSRPEHVTAWTEAGHDVLAFVELVAVVAQISSIDSYRVGLGAALDPLPEPIPGDPTPANNHEAATSNAWVPTVGIALAPTALNALPNEKAIKDAVSKEWYLTDEYVHKYDADPGRELTRGQMELVASRTSYLNECFF